MTDTRDTRLRRLKIRSWRRGTREMDLILGPFADSELGRLEEADLAAYEALLEENDQDLYAWVSGTAEAAAAHEGLIRRIASWHQIG